MKKKKPSTRLTSARLLKNRPLDEASDFKDEQAPAAKETGSLLAEQPPKPTVVGDRIQMHFLKPSFSKTTKGERLLALHLSFALTAEHTKDNLLPKAIREGWTIMSKQGRKRFDLEIPDGQRAVFYLAHDGKDDKLTLPAAKVINVSIAVVQKKGDGETQRIIRLSFRLQIPVSREVANFAENNYGSDFWLTLKETEEPLFDDEGE